MAKARQFCRHSLDKCQRCTVCVVDPQEHTDPEALDAAIRLAGTIRWFEGGIDTEPPYDLIVTTFRACFDIYKRVYPGSRDRAYHSGRAILWIRTLAACKSKESAHRFPLVCDWCTAPPSDHDLTHLLKITSHGTLDTRFRCLIETNSNHTPSHLQWISDVLLHHSWANRTTLEFWSIQGRVYTNKTTVPLDVLLKRLLAWCICLGSPVEEEALKV